MIYFAEIFILHFFKNMKAHTLWLSIILIVSLSSCTTSPLEKDTEILTGQIKKIQVDCGGWGLKADDELYELVKLPDNFKENGLRVQMAISNRQDLASCTMVGPIVEVLSIQRIEAL